MKLLVTGATGYVGAHTVKILKQQGHIVHAVDRNGFKAGNNIEKYTDRFLQMSVNNYMIDVHFDMHYDAIIHLAAYISPAESMTDPMKYYRNNVFSTVNAMKMFNYNHFVFASTGSAFDPVSPYSKSKVMCEQIIKDHCKQQGKDFTIFRFFNVAGNDGEFAQTVAPIHIMKLAAMTAAGKRDKFTIFGNDYGTRDRTCIRDYVHPSDIGRAIQRCLEDPANTDYECLAVRRDEKIVIDGYGPFCAQGYSNKEIVKIMQDVSGVNFRVEYGPRREGDAPIFVVDKVSKYFVAENTIEDMCRQEYEYERQT